VPALPSWLAQPLWDRFAALLPARETYVSTHPWGCHRRRIPDRIVFDKLVQVLRFGCSYQHIADSTCSATTIRARRDEWIRLGVFTQLKRIALDAYDRIVGLVVEFVNSSGVTLRRAVSAAWVVGRSGRAGPAGLCG
jgi:transposase